MVTKFFYIFDDNDMFIVLCLDIYNMKHFVVKDMFMLKCLMLFIEKNNLSTFD